MGGKADLYHSQGKVLGAAVEGLRGLREEACIFAKKPFLLQDQKALVPVVATFQQTQHCVKQPVT